MLRTADREIRLGIWKIHILHHAEERQVWGAWLIEELAEHGHRLSPGTLYPAIARMEKSGWLARGTRAQHARARQTFRITAAGRRLLEALRHDVTELYEEIVLQRARGHRDAEPRPASEALARQSRRSKATQRTSRRRS